MPDHFSSQRQGLINAINAFEPVVASLHKSYKREQFGDWPTIVLATTLQTSAISLFKLLPDAEPRREPLDQRSIASIIRNIIDTHDALDLLINTTTPEEFNLHHDIMGLYLSGRIAKIQSKISPEEAHSFYPRTSRWYWQRIKSSPLYEKSMDRLKSGESIFYTTRSQRVKKACGAQADLVMGVIADLSTYVHSLPPAVWMGQVNDLYADNLKHRDVIAVWLRIVNFYLARSFAFVLKIYNHEASFELKAFIDVHETVFAD